VASALKAVIENYAVKSDVVSMPEYDAEDLSWVLSLVTSTGVVILMPLYVRLMLPLSFAGFKDDAPTIELVLGYSRSNPSALLKRFLARADQLLPAWRSPMRIFCPCLRLSLLTLSLNTFAE
jgi:LysR family transcriptional regulator, hca operon transcriptional activator